MQRKPKAARADWRKVYVEVVAEILRNYTFSPFQHQASCVHGLRVRFILDGLSWDRAQSLADEIVKAALDRIGARRPSWEQGQPECVHETSFVQHTRCGRCGKNLVEDQRRYCSTVCRAAARNAVLLEIRGEEIRARRRVVDEARRRAWSDRQPARACVGCGRAFKPRSPDNPNQRYCEQRCASKDNRAAA